MCGQVRGDGDVKGPLSLPAGARWDGEVHARSGVVAGTINGVIRVDGLMQHDMYVMQVKKPSESKYAWDYYRVVKKISGEQAFGKLVDSTCPLLKK